LCKNLNDQNIVTAILIVWREKREWCSDSSLHRTSITYLCNEMQLHVRYTLHHPFFVLGMVLLGICREVFSFQNKVSSDGKDMSFIMCWECVELDWWCLSLLQIAVVQLIKWLFPFTLPLYQSLWCAQPTIIQVLCSFVQE